MEIEMICPKCGCKFTGLGYLRDNVLYCCESCADGGDCECEGCADDEERNPAVTTGS